MKNFKKMHVYVFLFVLIVFLLNGCKKTDETITKKDPVITWENPADISFGTSLSATQLNAAADVSGTFVYTPTSGTKLEVGANQAIKVDFTPSNEKLYNAVSKTVTINVNPKKDPVITWLNPADITLPTPLSTTQLNATADIPGSFTYTPALGVVLNVGNSQTIKVSFTPTDAANYNTVTKSVTINVNASGNVTDYDGNVYHTVVIGTQTWTVENLKVTHYRNGDPITNVTDNGTWGTLTTEAYCFYNNLSTNKDVYGALYNWYAVTDSRNIAPVGWHVPSDAEWTTLTSFLGGANVAGAKMKEYGIVHWKSPNNATNVSGLTVLPSGDRGSMSGMQTTGLFLNQTEYGSYWTSTQCDATKGYSRYLYYGSAGIGRDNGYLKINGFGVRLVKD